VRLPWCHRRGHCKSFVVLFDSEAFVERATTEIARPIARRKEQHMTDTSLPDTSKNELTTTEAESPSSVEVAKEATKAVAQSTADETKVVVAEAKENARDLVADARGQLRAQADEQASRLAGALHGLGAQLSSMSRADDASGAAMEMARQAAQRSEQIASRIEQGGLDEVMDDAKRFARNRPVLFLLSAIGAGFVVGRIIKNSDTTAITAAAKPDPAIGSDASASSDGRPNAFSPQAGLQLGAIAESMDAPMSAPDAWEA
jgi:hypothetical protein